MATGAGLGILAGLAVLLIAKTAPAPPTAVVIEIAYPSDPPVVQPIWEARTLEAIVEAARKPSWETVTTRSARPDPAPEPDPPQAKRPEPPNRTADAQEGGHGFFLIDAASGAVLSERNADRPLVPASIGKILAAVAILETHGAEGRLRTALLADGAIRNGVLDGDLHLVGSGDPTLTTADLRGLAQQFAGTGIRSIAGTFYFHGGAVPRSPAIEPSQPRVAYNPGIGGLNIDYNIRGDGTPVPQPDRHAARIFRSEARRAGVGLPAPKRASQGPSGYEIAAHDSAPIANILTGMFATSRNLTAEALGTIAAAKLGGRPKDLADAARITSDWVRGQIGPIGGSGWRGFDIRRHSGLSRTSTVTARQMAAITRFGYQRFGPVFARIHKRHQGGRSQGIDYAIRAKIGTMRYIRGLAGFMTIAGRDLIFTIMSTESGRRTARADDWMNTARNREQALLSDWMKGYWPRG